MLIIFQINKLIIINIFYRHKVLIIWTKQFIKKFENLKIFPKKIEILSKIEKRMIEITRKIR